MAAVFEDYDSSDSWDNSDDELVVDHQEELDMVVSPSLSNIVDAFKHLELEETAEDYSDFERLDEYAMDHLFGFLSVKNLKNCRLVDKAWNRACLRVIPQQHHVVRVPKPVEEINQLIALIRSSDQFPWTKFELNAEEIKTIEEGSAVSLLLAAVAPFVWELAINAIYGRTFNLVSIKGTEFPALKVVKFTCGLDPLGNGMELVTDIVNGANLLDLLELDGLTYKMTPSFLDLLETDNGQRISGLVIKWIVKREDLVRLSQLGLRLKSLYLHFYHQLSSQLSPEHIISSESLQTLLQSQSTYLKTLKLAVQLWDDEKSFDDDGQLIPEVRFPSMPNLTLLTIGFSSNFRDINYATLFPALKALQFDGFTDQLGLGFFHGGKNPVETLEVLKIRFNFESCNDAHYHIWCASKKFLNLRKMQLPNGLSLLQSLSMMVMPKLEELWLVCFSDADDQSMDSGFCGISGSLFYNLCKLSVSNVKTMARNFEPPSCLKGIRKLVLVAGKGRQEPLLPSIHIAYYFGFLKMKRLETIELVGNVSEISEKGMKALRRKFMVIIRD